MKLLIDFPEIDLKFIRETYKGTGCSFVPSAIQNECVEAVYDGTPYEERKTGKWKKELLATVPFAIYWYGCPFCEFRTATNNFNFCPCCGAKMEVDE